MKSPNTALMSFAEWMKDIPKDTLLDIQSTPTAIVFSKSTPIESPEEKHYHGTSLGLSTCKECISTLLQKVFALEVAECKGTHSLDEKQYQEDIKAGVDVSGEEEKGGWEERFEKKVKELKNQRPELYDESEPVEFGYTVDRSDEVFRVVDFGNIKSFLRSELATARKEAQKQSERDIEFLKKCHKMEIEAISLKSIEDFILWKDTIIPSPSKLIK